MEMHVVHVCIVFLSDFVMFIKRQGKLVEIACVIFNARG